MRTFYAVYDKYSGELFSVGSLVEPEKLPANLEFKEIGNEQPDLATKTWNKSTKSFVDVKEVAPVGLDYDTVLQELASIRARLDSIEAEVMKWQK